MSDYERVKESVSLKDYANANLEHTRGGLVCPKCGSGMGPSKTPAFSVKGDKWKCFSCDEGGDVFELAGILHGTDEKREQLQIVAEWGGVALEGRGGFKSTGDWSKVKSAGGTSQPKGKKDEYAEGREKHRRYIAECARRLAEEPNEAVNAYLQARGFTLEDAIKLGFGYDDEPAHGWKDENGNRHNTPRLVIPWAGTDYYHIDRAIDDRAKAIKYDKPPSTPDDEKGITEADCVGAQPVFNAEGFGQSYVIVVEGALDAYAIQLCGYNAIALGGTGANNFTTEAKERNFTGVVIDMLDADEAGEKAGASLCELMEEAGITCLSRADYGMVAGDRYGAGYKDACEWMEHDRADLSDMLEVMRGMALDKAANAKETAYREAMKNLKVENPAKIARDIFTCEDEERPISTGFYSFDNAINGGLRSGLTVLGAVSSAGKTTFLSQVGDFIAANGKPVLFVSIEQSGRELVAKSISRMMAARGYRDVTFYEMSTARYRALWGNDKTRALDDAIEEYAETVAPNLHVMAASDQPSINDVKAAAYHIADKRGESPVIILDYLQILKPINERDTERQAVDGNISELRRLSSGNGLKTPVITISSFNRGSYSGAIEMESFKESGGVEYGADLLLGIQPYRMEQTVTARTKDDKPPTEQVMKFRAREIVKQFRKQHVKHAELVFLKNRNGALPAESLPFTFYAASSLFVEGIDNF